MLIDVDGLVREFREREPDPTVPVQRVKFGTSGHRGTPRDGSFTASHIAAIAQAICEYRRSHGIDGPLYMGRDTHAVSAPAHAVALAVLAANGVVTVIQRDDGVTPTPAISRAILVWNRNRTDALADGIVVTPSHNPPEDGGLRQPPERRAGRHRRHALDPDAGERDPPWSQRRRSANLGGGRARSLHHPSGGSAHTLRR